MSSSKKSDEVYKMYNNPASLHTNVTESCVHSPAVCDHMYPVQCRETLPLAPLYRTVYLAVVQFVHCDACVCDCD